MNYYDELYRKLSLSELIGNFRYTWNLRHSVFSLVNNAEETAAGRKYCLAKHRETLRHYAKHIRERRQSK